MYIPESCHPRGKEVYVIVNSKQKTKQSSANIQKDHVVGDGIYRKGGGDTGACQCMPPQILTATGIAMIQVFVIVRSMKKKLGLVYNG